MVLNALVAHLAATLMWCQNPYRDDRKHLSVEREVTTGIFTFLIFAPGFPQHGQTVHDEKLGGGLGMWQLLLF